MTPDELKDRQHQEAWSDMLENGKGILSPRKYHEKRIAFIFVGFGVGCFASVAFTNWMSWSMDGTFWQILGCITTIAIGCLGGIFVGAAIFAENFVCDESIDEPLFGRAYRDRHFR